MKKIKVLVGNVKSNGDNTEDSTQEVEFVGVKLGSQITLLDPLAFRETLYETADNRFLVHKKDWSQETTITYTLTEISQEVKDLLLEIMYPSLE